MSKAPRTMQATLNLLLAHKKRLPLIDRGDSTPCTITMSFQFAIRNNQETNTAVPFYSLTLTIPNPFWTSKRKQSLGKFTHGHGAQINFGKIQVNWGKKTVSEDSRHESGDNRAAQSNNQFVFTATKAQLVRPWGTHHKTINKHWKVKLDLLTTIATATKTTHAVSSSVSRVLHQSWWNTNSWRPENINFA